MPRDRETALAGGGLVAWREWGDADGDPILLLHGNPDEGHFPLITLWAEIVERSLARG